MYEAYYKVQKHLHPAAILSHLSSSIFTTSYLFRRDFSFELKVSKELLKPWQKLVS